MFVCAAMNDVPNLSWGTFSALLAVCHTSSLFEPVTQDSRVWGTTWRQKQIRKYDPTLRIIWRRIEGHCLVCRKTYGRSAVRRQRLTAGTKMYVDTNHIANQKNTSVFRPLGLAALTEAWRMYFVSGEQSDRPLLYPALEDNPQMARCFHANRDSAKLLFFP